MENTAKPESMTSRQRVLAALSRQPVDRTPVCNPTSVATVELMDLVDAPFPDAKRRSAIAGGLVKLGEMEWAEGGQDEVAFLCGQAHDELIGVLLVRALNVRAILREQEMSASRGQLLAPSAQEQ